MRKSSLFKRFWNLEMQQGGVCTVRHPASALNPSWWVLYSIFMQSWVLWEEPELAVDSERSWSSGKRDPVDAICPIIFISFGQRRVPTSRPRKLTKTTLSHKIQVPSLHFVFKFWRWRWWHSDRFPENKDVFPSRKNKLHLAVQS